MNVPDRKQRFAETVRGLRNARKLSQARLAERAKVDIKTIQRIERGTMLPNLAMVWDLADVFNVTVAQAIGEDLTPVIPGPFDDDLAETVRRLEAAAQDNRALAQLALDNQEKAAADVQTLLADLVRRVSALEHRGRKVEQR